MKTDLYNIKLSLINKQKVLSNCEEYFFSDKTHTLFFLNAHCFNIAQKEHDYRQIINSSDLLLNDGLGIYMASKMAGVKLYENLNGTDLIPEILKLANKKSVKVFFLGGKRKIASKAAGRIKQSVPGINIAGTNPGYFTKDQEKCVIDKINNSQAQLLVLGMGVPRQEKWAAENKELLENIKIIVAGGAILDFMSGEKKRAPMIMRKFSMEWLYRLYLEPARMWKRYIIGNFLFLFYVLRFKLS